MGIKVAFLDDHKMFLESITQKLAQQYPEISVELVETNSNTFLTKLSKVKPNIVVLNLVLTADPVDGNAIASKIKERYPKIKTMMLSGRTDSASVRAAFRHGVKAFVSKTASIEELATAINAVHSGERYVSEVLRTITLYEFLEELTFRSTTLSPDSLSLREKEIITLIARGFTIQDIAKFLNVQTRTITTHTSNIRRKTGMATDAHLTKFALKNGWLTLDD